MDPGRRDDLVECDCRSDGSGDLIDLDPEALECVEDQLLIRVDLLHVNLPVVVAVVLEQVEGGVVVVCEVACRVVLALGAHQLLCRGERGVCRLVLRPPCVMYFDVAHLCPSRRRVGVGAYPWLERRVGDRLYRSRVIVHNLLVALLRLRHHLLLCFRDHLLSHLRPLLLIEEGVFRLTMLGESAVAPHQGAKGDNDEQDQEEAHQQERPHQTYMERKEACRLVPEDPTREEKPPVRPLRRHETEGDRGPESCADAETDLADPRDPHHQRDPHPHHQDEVQEEDQPESDPLVHQRIHQRKAGDPAVTLYPLCRLLCGYILPQEETLILRSGDEVGEEVVD